MKNSNDSFTDRQRTGVHGPLLGSSQLTTFRASRITDSGRRTFFQSGEEHLDSVIRTIRDKLSPEFPSTRALDFHGGLKGVFLSAAE